MNILIISTPRAPTLNVGSNGLGRHVYDFIIKFVEKKDKVTVISHPGSVFDPDMNIHRYNFTDERTYVQDVINVIRKEKYDVIIDNTHYKILSQVCGGEFPILNFIHDEECPYMPPNTLLGNTKQQKRYVNGKVYKTGIIFKNYPLFPINKREKYFSFCGKLEKRKGYDIALEAAKRAGVDLIFAGPDVDRKAHILPKWIGEVIDRDEFFKFVGSSKALYYPSRSDAGGMGIWEAAALGTPTLTTIQSGAECNVIHEKTGYVAQTFQDLIDYTSLISESQPDPEEVRENAKQIWDLDTNFEKIYNLIERLSNGERW